MRYYSRKKMLTPLTFNFLSKLPHSHTLLFPLLSTILQY